MRRSWAVARAAIWDDGRYVSLKTGRGRAFVSSTREFGLGGWGFGLFLSLLRVLCVVIVVVVVLELELELGWTGGSCMADRERFLEAMVSLFLSSSFRKVEESGENMRMLKYLNTNS